MKTIRGNSYGGAQDFNNMPEDLRTYVNPVFLKGGNRNQRGPRIGGLADKVKSTQDDIAKAKTMVARIPEGGGGRSLAASSAGSALQGCNGGCNAGRGQIFRGTERTGVRLRCRLI
jgi:hypothetical protein